MSSDEFKERYLAPIENAIKVSSIKRRPLLDEYACPLGDAMHVEQAIQRYFNGRIANDLFHDVDDTDNYFGSPSIIDPIGSTKNSTT
ncbi:unnamed protein product [Debaryomyces tyrocola]|nr:unnamed protein product [Debaryomyces tyrocola]